ncbi:hypothetical protein Plhal304r1_c008g0033941 [Plasmopara halstedii]
MYSVFETNICTLLDRFLARKHMHAQYLTRSLSQNTEGNNKASVRLQYDFDVTR